MSHKTSQIEFANRQHSLFRPPKTPKNPNFPRRTPGCELPVQHVAGRAASEQSGEPATGGERNGRSTPSGFPGWMGTTRRERFVEETGRPGGVEAAARQTLRRPEPLRATPPPRRSQKPRRTRETTNRAQNSTTSRRATRAEAHRSQRHTVAGRPKWLCPREWHSGS